MKQNNQLRRERQLRGWSQARVAELIGTETPTVSRWERGISFPYPYFREKLCTLFGKDAQSLGLVPTANEHEEEQDTVPPPAPAPSALALSERLHDPAIPFFPAGTPELIGRDILLKQLKQRLCSGTSVALTALNGLPGVGKTTLAMALVSDSQVQARFTDGILWAGLGPDPNVAALLSRWSSLLGVSAEETGKVGNQDAWTIMLRGAIGMRRMLLVIDDAWELESALAFKVGGPNCAYLLTTRLPAIAVSFADEGATVVPELSQEDGVALLARFVPDAVAHDSKTAHELVSSVGALPLALALMGKYLRIQATNGQPRRLYTAIENLHNVVQRLRLSEPSAVINHPSGLSAGTPLSLQSVIEISYQHLDDDGRQALCALSVFPAKPNTFSEEAALAICRAPVEILDALSDSGLLESSSPGRYMLHQTIADYARACLKELAPYERLITYGLGYVEMHLTDYEVLEPESSTVLAALEAAHMLGKKSRLVWGAAAIAPFLHFRGLHLLSERYLHWAYQAATELQDHSGLMSIVLHLGKIAQEQRKYGEAEAFLHEGLGLARQLSDREQMCALLQNLGILANDLGNYGEAEAFLHEGLGLARQLGDREQMCALLQNLGVVTAKQGNYSEAEGFLQEGLDLARRFDDREQISALLQNLSVVADEQAKYTQAELYLSEGLTLARQLGHRERVNMLLILLGWILTKQKSYAEAKVYLFEGLTLARQLSHRDRAIVLLQNLGMVARKQKNHAEAKAYLSEGLALARQLDQSKQVGVLLAVLAAILIEQEDYSQAETYLQEGLALARQSENRQLLSTLLVEYSELLLKMQRIESAIASLREVLELARGDQQLLMAHAYYGLARAALAQCQIDEARHLGETSLALFEAIESENVAEVRDWLRSLPPLS